MLGTTVMDLGDARVVIPTARLLSPRVVCAEAGWILEDDLGSHNHSWVLIPLAAAVLDVALLLEQVSLFPATWCAQQCFLLLCLVVETARSTLLPAGMANSVPSQFIPQASASSPASCRSLDHLFIPQISKERGLRKKGNEQKGILDPLLEKGLVWLVRGVVVLHWAEAWVPA